MTVIFSRDNLTEIFSNLCRSDLHTAFLVCRSWAAQPRRMHVISTKGVYFLKESHVPRFLNRMGWSSDRFDRIPINGPNAKAITGSFPGPAKGERTIHMQRLLNFHATNLSFLCLRADDTLALSSPPSLNRLQWLSLQNAAGSDALLRGIAKASGESLRHIEITHGRNVSDVALLELSQHCPNITALDLSDSCQFSDVGISTFQQRLRFLSVHGIVGRVSDRVLFSVSWNGLQNVDISHTRGSITDEGIMVLAKECPLLKCLNVSNTDGAVTDLSLLQVADSCPSLESLSVAYTRGKVTDTSLSVIAQKCQLRVLNVMGCIQGVTDATFRELSSHCYDLESLNFSFTRGVITTDGILLVVEQCTRLQYVHMKDAGLISRQDFCESLVKKHHSLYPDSPLLVVEWKS